MYGKDLDGIGRAIKVDKTGHIRSDLAQAALEGRLFHIATATTVQTSTTLNTTFTGLGICNPVGSGKLLIFHEFGFGMTRDLEGNGVLALAFTDDTGFSADKTVRSSMHGGSVGSVAQAMESATIAAPVHCKVIGVVNEDSESGNGHTFVTDLRGSLILRPGYALVTDCTRAVGAHISFHFQWEEIGE